VHINKNGTVAAGTDRGEILLWSIDLKAFVKSQTTRNPNPQSIVSFVDSFKMFSKAVHFCEFSPNGGSLFIGSDDGTAKIWRIEKGKDIKLTATNELVTFEVKRKPSKQDKNLMFTDVSCINF
jgi:WD40 repeat protein